jgi:nucleotide-binding universal stress UspA family protein
MEAQPPIGALWRVDLLRGRATAPTAATEAGAPLVGVVALLHGEGSGKMQLDIARTLRRRRRVVVGVNGSAGSHRALQWALRYADQTTAVLEAVCVWQMPPVTDFGIGWTPEVFTGQDAEAAAGAVLAAAVAEVAGDEPLVPIRCRVLRGRPTDVLLSAATFADLLVVGSRGHGTLAGILLDSVSQHCVQRAPCPVIVVPDASATSPTRLLSRLRISGRRALPALLGGRHDDVGHWRDQVSVMTPDSRFPGEATNRSEV